MDDADARVIVRKFLAKNGFETSGVNRNHWVKDISHNGIKYQFLVVARKRIDMFLIRHGTYWVPETLIEIYDNLENYKRLAMEFNEKVKEYFEDYE